MEKSKVSILQVKEFVCSLPIQMPMFSEFDFLQYVKLAKMRIIFKMEIAENSLGKKSFAYCFFDNDIQVLVSIQENREAEFERELVKQYV